MFVTEFALKYSFKNSDISVAEKVYGKTKMSEKEWFGKLSKEFVFQDTETLRKIREAKEKKTLVLENQNEEKQPIKKKDKK